MTNNVEGVESPIGEIFVEMGEKVFPRTIVNNSLQERGTKIFG
jgi:hypothetical protein